MTISNEYSTHAFVKLKRCELSGCIGKYTNHLGAIAFIQGKE